MIQGKVVSRSKDWVPKYGVEVDKGLISDINVRISLGLPIDNVSSKYQSDGTSEGARRKPHIW
jgi:hypothetical protein